jgi:hypothetical protein
MKSVIFAATAAVAIFTGCARDNAVAMNLYQPDGDYERASGTTVVITQDMIDRVKKQHQ